MGRYIEQLANGTLLPPKGKALFLIQKAGAFLDSGNKFREDLVCVVTNGDWDAAGYASDENTYQRMRREDGRQKTWLVVPNAGQLAPEEDFRGL